MAFRHPPELESQICALYKQGLSEREIGKRLQISGASAHEVLVRCNVARRPTGQRSPNKLHALELRAATAAAMYMTGMSFRAVGEKLRLDTREVKRAVLRFGGEVRMAPGPAKGTQCASVLDEAKVFALRCDVLHFGHAWKSIGRKYGVTATSARDAGLGYTWKHVPFRTLADVANDNAGEEALSA